MLLRHFGSFTVSGIPVFDGIFPICMVFLRFQSERLKHTEGKETQRVGTEELKQTARTQESHYIDQVGLELPGSISSAFGLLIRSITPGFN